MNNKTVLTHANIEAMCISIGSLLGVHARVKYPEEQFGSFMGKCFPIPRGGVPAAYAFASNFNVDIVDTPEEADFFIDDIIDSGDTMREWCERYPGKPFFALVDKTDPIEAALYPGYVVFPWEGDSNTSIEGNVRRLLQFAGDDPSREGLLETPRRVAKALSHWFSGYDKDPKSILKVFEDGGENYDQMVVVKDIPIYSKCEHHMADIFGTATIAYIPNGKIVGLSKLSRLADMFARRLQVQERLTANIADALQEHLQPKGVGVIIKARHMCMESRGICQQGHHTVTTALRGVILNEPATRAEFLSHGK